MANLNVRIKNKFDTYENWMSSTLILEAGEIAIASIPSGDNTGLTPPAIGVKVGDGSKTFSQLSWIQATAGDVYGWAKAANKPAYTADEIGGLSEYISGEIQDTDTQYKLVKVDDYNYKLQSKALNGAWEDVEGSSFVIPKYDDTALAGRVTATENAITAIKDGAAIDSFLDVENALAGKQATGDYALNSSVNEVSDRVAAIEGDYLKAADKYNDTAIVGRVANIEKDYLKAADKTELDGKIATAQGAAEAAQGAVDTLAGKVGAVTEGKTVVEMIADAQAAATYDDTALAARVTENEGAIEVLDGQVATLVGEDTDKSVRTIANEELAKQLIPEGAKEALNELQEIAAWIQSHPDDASAMNAAITALQNKLAGIGEGEGTVKKYVDDAIAALNIGQYALAADLTALAGRVEALEGKMTTAEGDIEALQAADTELDGKITALDNSLATVAKTGNVADLVQTEGAVLILDCGTSAV